ncbi:MAG TPA: TorF family putative porin [Sphingomonas sp.]|jgi:hypothetical protein|uniref:TorF family putative porin n=1 Tax=Sphingomonas sp. TaxID=28214 RepID=UPI002EDAD912
MTLSAWSIAITLLSTAAVVTPVLAQSSMAAGVEAASEEARRGLSWSRGRAVGSADVAVRSGPVDASARLVTLRGSTRHGNADAVADVAIGAEWDLGAMRLRPAATVHLFTGARGKMDYFELGTSGSFTYGPVQLIGGVTFAPPQDAIGGSNLFIHASANAGIPGTPLTVIADLGHSSGSVDDPLRSQRLRPGGAYANWRIGVERRRGPLTLAVDYIGTDVSRTDTEVPFADARHAGDRIIGRARLEL